jgi:hypothetical protein
MEDILEILAITIYGFPMEQALPAAMIVGTLDPMATLLNANGDVVSAMVITRVSEGKKWLSAVVQLNKKYAYF